MCAQRAPTPGRNRTSRPARHEREFEAPASTRRALRDRSKERYCAVRSPTVAFPKPHFGTRGKRGRISLTGVWRLFRLAVAAPGWYRVSVADSSPPNSIFMCYRRDDSADVAGRIYDRLVAEFGKDAIYRDVDTIPFGEDFREHIHACLSTCRVGLVVIGPEWCSTAGRSGLVRDCTSPQIMCGWKSRRCWRAGR